MLAERIEIFCAAFSVEINDDPVFFSFVDGSVLQTYQEKIGALVGNSSETKTPQKEEAVFLSLDSIAWRSAVVNISSGSKVKAEVLFLSISRTF